MVTNMTTTDTDAELFLPTCTGRRVHLVNPQPEEIDIEDIAHALSHTCRFAGHVPVHFSVAQHSVLVSELLGKHGPDVALWGLLHDASEAYLHDLTRPLKRALQDDSHGWKYGELERRMMAAICVRFRLHSAMPPLVKAADNAVLAAELRDLLHQPLATCVLWAGAQPMKRTIKPHCPEAAKDIFLVRFEKLVSARRSE